MKRNITLLDWMFVLMIFFLAGMAIGVRASYGQRSVEQAFNNASEFQSWEDELRQRERLVTERNAQQQAANQQAARALTERIQAHNQQVQQREQRLRQQYEQHLQGQQTDAIQREEALQTQLKKQKEQAALEHLHQGMQMQALLERLQSTERIQQAKNIPERAYGYAEKPVPEKQNQPAQIKAPVQPIPQQQSQPSTTVLLFQQPAPPPPVVPQTTQLKTIVNGIDQIETKVVLPSRLEVDQLEAVKKIADNGVIIAQQRLGLEQGDMTSQTALAQLSVWKEFVLWGLMLSIPFLLTMFWIAKQAAVGWHAWQQNKLDYKLKELASAERQIAMSNSTYHSSQKRR